MRGTIDIIRLVRDQPWLYLGSITDIEYAWRFGRPVLFVADQQTGAVGSYSLNIFGQVRHYGSIVDPDDERSGLTGVNDLTILRHPGELRLGIAGRGDNNSATYNVADGQLLGGRELLGGQDWAYVELATPAKIDTTNLLVTTRSGRTDLIFHRIARDDELRHVATVEDPEILPFADFSAIDAVPSRPGLLYVASAFDRLIASLRFDEEGEVVVRKILAPNGNFPFGRITEIEMARVGGSTYLVAADASTDALVLIETWGGGGMRFADRVADTQETRFAGPAALRVLEFDDSGYVAVGGAEGGFSIFEIRKLAGRGELKHVATIDDGPFRSLDDIGAIDFVFIRGTVQLAIGSLTEPGLTIASFEFERADRKLIGSDAPDTLNGARVDDLMFGGEGNDTLFGNDGDDWLVGGRGTDRYWGGGGADVFEFKPDGQADIIQDYQHLIDSIDISDYDRVNSVDDLRIEQRFFGAKIFLENDSIIIQSKNGAPITFEQLADDFLFV
ncbi:MAG: hypothetical protein AAGE18_11835 [Pseudomonadota bacterium]